MGEYDRKCVILWCLLILFLFPDVSFSQGNPLADFESRVIQGPSVSDLAAYASRTNPSIESARQAWKAVVERYRIVTAYPDPVVLFSYFPKPIETRLGPQDWNANLSQTIPFPGKLSKAGELVQVDARIARLNLDKALRDVIVKIRESYHELLYIRDAKQVVAQNRELLDHLRKVGETAYARDRTVLLDVMKAQSQSAQLMYDALLLEELDQTEKTQLNTLLSRPPEAGIGPLASFGLRPLAYGLDEIYGLAKQYQEEIQIAGAQMERSETRTSLAKYEALPEFRLGAFYTGIGKPDMAMLPKDAGRDSVGVQFGFTIPVWIGKNAGRIQEARAETERARSNKTAQVNDTLAQIRSLYFRLQNSERLIRLYRDQLLPQAAQSLETAETWFREKQGSFSDFVETEAVYYNFQLALARAKADYGKYLARLERLSGRTLVDRNERGGEEKPK